MQHYKVGIFHSFAGHWQLVTEQLKMKTIWYYENFSNPRKTVELNRPNLNYIRDLKDVTNDVDIIVGSPPCVGISRANPKACLNHFTNDGMINFSKIVKKVRPSFFVMEMVSSLTRPRFEILFAQLLKNFKKYHNTNWTVFNYVNYGTPQIRKRVFIYGALDKKLIFPEIMYSDDNKLFKKIRTVKFAFKGLKNYSEDEAVELKLTRKFNPKWKGAFSVYLKNKDSFILKWNRPSKTITNINTKYFIHPDKHRLITYREAARLMEFPDNYIFNRCVTTNIRDIAWGVPIHGTVNILREIVK